MENSEPVDNYDKFASEISDPIDDYDKFASEIIAFDATFGKFTQLCYFGENNIFSEYGQAISLLYSAVSEQYVEFNDGKPSFFVSYHLIVSIGSSKDPEYCRGIAKLMNDKIDISDCNFYSDFFFQHPLTIKVMDCYDKNCDKNNDLMKKGVWCIVCNGEFKHASQLQSFMHDTIKFTNIPRYSVIAIEKNTIKIDETDLECLKTIQQFLKSDKQKIAILQSSILNTEEKINKYIAKLDGEKAYKQRNLDKMLSIRGGSLENYINMLMEFDTKLTNLLKQEDQSA